MLGFQKDFPAISPDSTQSDQPLLLGTKHKDQVWYFCAKFGLLQLWFSSQACYLTSVKNMKRWGFVSMLAFAFMHDPYQTISAVSFIWFL